MKLSSIFGLGGRAAGEQRLGPYLLGPKIGEGGMGAVYRARHARKKETVAIKLLGGGAGRGADQARFEREVAAARGLGSPNIVAVYDHGRTAQGTPYYVMEYVDGYDLEGLVARFGPLPPARVVHLLIQICDALAAVHDAGLVHRDVKPANIAVTGGAATTGGPAHEVVKLLDFGLVRRMDAVMGEPSSSLPSAVIGTPGYMAPEAMTAPASVDARSDLYALGAVAYYLLTGTRVFRGGNAILECTQHLHAEPQPPSQRTAQAIPADLEAIVLRCLEKDPARRPASARALRDLLAACACADGWRQGQAARWWDQHRPGEEAPLPLPLAA